MTNGEKIQTILNVDRDCTEVCGENGMMTFTVTQDFWNAEYKEQPTGELYEVLDKIRTEIMDIHIAQVPGYKIVGNALDIIAKYKRQIQLHQNVII